MIGSELMANYEEEEWLCRMSQARLTKSVNTVPSQVLKYTFVDHKVHSSNTIKLQDHKSSLSRYAAITMTTVICNALHHNIHGIFQPSILYSPCSNRLTFFPLE